jgi:hypothetical protein
MVSVAVWSVAALGALRLKCIVNTPVPRLGALTDTAAAAPALTDVAVDIEKFETSGSALPDPLSFFVQLVSTVIHNNAKAQKIMTFLMR